ncbi:hypothetical protein RV06_GL001421 [Enterococcus haemoperoxidus]|nr:hypothetical protein RV06_GL001421 [Enterococcus haemoperoxidus]
MILSVIFFIFGVFSLFKFRATREKLYLYIALSYFGFSLTIVIVSHYLFN